METQDCPAGFAPDAAEDKASGESFALDVVLSGTVFYDMIFSELSRMPRPGEELWSKSLGYSPGGIANLAVACSRLGLTTGLVAGFGDDRNGEWIRSVLGTREGIDLSASPTFPGWPTPVTVAMSTREDRAMVTYGEELPAPLTPHILTVPRARAALVDLAMDTSWWAQLRANGTRLWADIGFDTTECWDPTVLEPLRDCYAFTPNAVEAMNYTRTDSPRAAAHALAERVELAIVTNGAEGVYAVDSGTGEEAFCPALSVEAIDPTGAGDVFAAASVMASLRGWPLEWRLRFAALCSAISVQRVGGAMGAPTWGDIRAWWSRTRKSAEDGDASTVALANSYRFLQDVLA